MSKAGRIKQRIKWGVKAGSWKGLGITVIVIMWALIIANYVIK